VTEEDKKRYFDRLLTGLSALMKEVGEDRTFILIGNVPSANLRGGYLNCAFRPVSKAKCHNDFAIEQGAFNESRPVLVDYTKSRTNVYFVDPYEALCDSHRCYVVKDGTLYYSDHGHLSKAGAETVVSHFAERIINK